MKRRLLFPTAFAVIGLLLVSVVFAQTRLGNPARELQLAERAYLTYSPRNYTGTGSFQPVGIDLNLGTAAGGTTGKFIAPIMGNLFGNNQTKAGNYYGGLVGHYNIAGTNATTYPSGAVLGGIGDGTTTAKGAFIAYIDGDSAQTNAGAAFKVMHNNSTAASKFTYGLDLYDPARDGYNAVSYANADVRLTNEICILSGSGVPVDGVSGTGAGFAGTGSLYVRTTGVLYINTNTKASPTWTVVGSQS